MTDKMNPLKPLIENAVKIRTWNRRYQCTDLMDRNLNILKTRSVLINRSVAEELVVQIKIITPPEFPNWINVLFFELLDPLAEPKIIHKCLIEGVGIVPKASYRYFSFVNGICHTKGDPFFCDAIGFDCSEEVDIDVLIYGT